MRFFLSAVICLLAPIAAAQTYNAEAQNIFDSVDPICNPASAASNGIIFCDGFEDGVFSPPGAAPGTSNDYWYAASSNGGGCDGCTDPTGRNWAETNTGVINPSRANFGAAGTKSTMTQGWNRGIEPSHCLRAVNGNPKYCQTSGGSSAGAVQNVYVRLYFKLAGVTSTRCSAGYPNCPTFNFMAGGEAGNQNGVKFIEMRDGLDTGGITYLNVSTDFEPHGDLLFGVGDPGSCVVGSGGNNAGKSCASEVGPGAYCEQHLTPRFNYYEHKDEWIFLEYHIKQTDAADSSTLEMWMDSCGRDGKSCPAVPTKRIEVRNFDLNPSEPICSVADALYINTWNPSGTNGEIQFDEIVVRDGAILDRPIGFFGGTPGSGTPIPVLPPPVLLP